jgi:hypothetical protein
MISPDEVEYVFSVPLLELMEPSSWTLDDLGTRGIHSCLLV